MATGEVRVVAGPDQDDALIAEIYAIQQATHAESPDPLDLLPLPQEMAMRRIQDEHYRWLTILVRNEAGTLMGLADCSLLEGMDVLQCAVRVLAPHRRQGVGRRLVAEAARIARAEGRQLLQGSTLDNFQPAQAFCDHLGAKAGLAIRNSRLDLQAIDAAELQGWVDAAQQQSCSLLWLDNQTPEQWLSEVTNVMRVMNTAPTGELESADVPWSEALVKANEEYFAQMGLERWACYIRDDHTGHLVGMHDVLLWSRETLAIQNTAVAPSHRGRGLGKWLKAAMILRVRRERPEGRWMVTLNAHSNAGMLAINDQLGFAPTDPGLVAWQVRVAELPDGLGT